MLFAMSREAVHIVNKHRTWGASGPMNITKYKQMYRACKLHLIHEIMIIELLDQTCCTFLYM